jgi:uncharacterized protein
MSCSLLDRALVHAVTVGDIAAVQALLEQGADVNARAATGETVLMLAASAARPELVEILIARGANEEAPRVGAAARLE